MFQAASAIKEAVLREWTLLEQQNIESLRAFLLSFVLQKQGYVDVHLVVMVTLFPMLLLSLEVVVDVYFPSG
jgi:hypothetical protein